MPVSSRSLQRRSSSAIYNGGDSDEQVLVPLLAWRSCHLPGNNWKEDWMQWFRNNHILFGICLHHPLHPLEGWERCLLLAASVSFGLVATNIHLIYQYMWGSDYDFDGDNQDALVSFAGYRITPGMLIMVTVTGLAHSIFDMVTWDIMACACCHPGGRWGDHNYSKRYKDCGSYVLLPMILGLVGFSVVLVLLIASSDDEQIEADEFHISIDNWRSFAFLWQYATELALTWFVFFPMVGTIVFSGILGCGGRLPILGGRPYDVKRVEEGRYGLFNQKSMYASF